MNISDELQNDLNKCSVHYVSDLYSIAEKHGVDVMDLLAYDCATSTTALLRLGYGGKLTTLIREYYNE